MVFMGTSYSMRRAVASLLLTAAGPLIAAATTNQAGENRLSEKAVRMDAVVAHYRELGYLNGAVLVADGGKIIYESGVGEKNMESHAANTPNTKFGIASITKQFTAVLVLQEVEEGKLSLDEKVADLLQWYRKDTGSRMTVEELLHHTSGLPPDYASPEFSNTSAAGVFYEPEAFGKAFCQQDLVSEPGTKWNYSNCGYDLLGLILERVSGKSFAALLREKLLDPLGMRDTGIDHNDLERLGGAVGYLRHAGPRYTRGLYVDRSHFFSAGAMYSTVEDLFRWSQALSEGRYVSKQIREQVFKPGLNEWGYGWFVTKIPAGEPGSGSTGAEMRGDMPDNYFSWILMYPERGGVIVVLRNGYGSTERLEQNLQALLFDQEPKLPSSNAKDIAARVWQVPVEKAVAYPVPSAVFGLLLAVALVFLTRRLALLQDWRKAKARD
jgi:CubicO group peptidase (beta-lactamase class C family)